MPISKPQEAHFSPIQKWLQDMRGIWINKTPDKISDLLSSTELIYYESPFEPPYTSIQDVVTAWQAILDQDIAYISIEILNETPRTGTAMWAFKEEGKLEYRGVYYLEVDSHGKCTLFRQWWNEAPSQNKASDNPKSLNDD